MLTVSHLNTLSDINPEVHRVVKQVADIYAVHTKPWFIGLVVHGSAVKGGFIPGCSDIDFVLYLEDDALNEYGKIP